ncbi:hypothetical protein BJ508DRAFT_418088 [Ascobolus immersus RN42]|uniref:Uncharacterized protein n=1 Tax=Ascobolus immersus RN42 TaxID=1160509 RepID=A0A3N4I0V8_ASCIM|nr:hypothetical protein BJ508DRAFT_418088 [Ascobolus immersus RN42]
MAYNRVNRVPHFQRLFQADDGRRIWMKTKLGRAMFYPYVGILGFTFAASVYGATRMAFGHKTWI